MTADVAATVAISSIASVGYSALVTTGSAHGLVLNQQISLQGITGAGKVYNGGYEVLSIPSTTTFLIPLNTPNLAASGAVGNVLTVAYPYKIRAEDMSWQDATAAGTISLTDTNGNQIWKATAPTTGNYSRTKPYWIDGLVINALPSGTLLITVN